MTNQPDTEKPVGAQKPIAPEIQALLTAIEGADECRRIDPTGRVCLHCWDKVLDAQLAVNPINLDITYG